MIRIIITITIRKRTKIKIRVRMRSRLELVAGINLMKLPPTLLRKKRIIPVQGSLSIIIITDFLMKLTQNKLCIENRSRFL